MKRKISLVPFEELNKPTPQPTSPLEGILTWESPPQRPFPHYPEPRQQDLLLDIMAKFQPEAEDKTINFKPRMKAKKFLK